jgi:hypothetical protein
MGDATTALGSWQVSLTSLEASGKSFTPHGTFTATMVANDGGTDTVTLSTTF